MKAMGKILFVIVLGLVAGMGCSPRAKITIKAVDEDGKPLAGLEASAGFLKGDKAEGTTDTNGLFTLKGHPAWGEVWYGVWKKDGFYASGGKYSFTNRMDGKWQPWNPVITSVVRRIINPIPMYAKYVDTKIPAENADLGYDLTLGDWIPPYGKGQVADFVFHFSRRISGNRDCEGTLKLTFPRPNDGILENREINQTSTFKLPRSAPQDVYDTNWTHRLGEDPKSGYFGLQGDGTDKEMRDEADVKYIDTVATMLNLSPEKLKWLRKFDETDLPLLEKELGKPLTNEQRNGIASALEIRSKKYDEASLADKL